MAREKIDVNEVLPNGFNLSDDGFTAANVDGISFDNGSGRVMLIVKNDDVSPVTVTVKSTATFVKGEITTSDGIGVVAASKISAFGTFEPAIFNTKSTGEVEVDFSSVTNLFVAAVKIA